MANDIDLNEVASKHYNCAAGDITAALGAEALQGFNAAYGATFDTSGVNHRVAELLKDDSMPLEGRQRRARDLVTESATTLRNANKQAHTVVTFLKAKLASAYTPKEPTDAAAVANGREEVRMLIEQADDPLDAVLAICTGRDRDLAGILASRWGRTYLAGHGLKDMDAMLSASLARGAEAHGDDKQKAAARAARSVDGLTKAQVARLGYAQEGLSAAAEQVGVSGHQSVRKAGAGHVPEFPSGGAA